MKYLNFLEQVDLSEERSKQIKSPATSKEQAQFWSLLGGLGWLAVLARPDLGFDVSVLASVISNLQVSHLLLANKAYRKAWAGKYLVLKFSSKIDSDFC